MVEVKLSRSTLLLLSISCFTMIISSMMTFCNAEESHKELDFISVENPVTALKPSFCVLQEQQRKMSRALKNSTITRDCKTFNSLNLKFFLSLFVIIAWGAMVRTVLRLTGLCIPYTVILMITGLAIGFGTRIKGQDEKNPSMGPKPPGGCEYWSVFTKIARMPPKIILYVFLPVLIFESAFSMNPHVFVRSAAQILIAALPGMLITTFVTALVCQNFLLAYDWDFPQASLFGSIISATDPVAVVAILKELGTSESLSTMIEGESLLNDGVAILLYEIFEKIVEDPNQENLALTIVKKFCQITLGGPAFGYFMAKISIFCLSRIFNDATVEITITLVAAYLTYYIGEAMLGVSGVMAVVVLGIAMSAERTSISPEVEILVHHFWEMLGYLANTVLFVLVGIVITETAINSVVAEDGYYMIFLYIALNIIRLFMLLVLSPCMSRTGYGLTWQNIIVMMWGGLRGAVAYSTGQQDTKFYSKITTVFSLFVTFPNAVTGICLALEVYTNQELCANPNVGPKFLLQTAAIVFLTLVINGTTTQALLDCLKITEISVGRIQDMSNAFKQIQGSQGRTIAVLKNDRFLADANWSLVEKLVAIENPYAKHRHTRKELEKVEKDMLHGHSSSPAVTDLNLKASEAKSVSHEPTKEEFREMTEEARLRCLKALKVSFWRQYEQGVLTEVAVQILRNAAASAEDQPLRILYARDLNKYWVLHGFFPWLQIRLTRRFGKKEDIVPKPKNPCKLCCWSISTSIIFEYFVMFIILVNIIIAAVDVGYLRIREEREEEKGRKTRSTQDLSLAFFALNVSFVGIYIFEAFVKLVGLGFRYYFCVDKWNYLDLILLILSLVDLGITTSERVGLVDSSKSNNGFILSLHFVRVFRVLRIFRLIRPLVPFILKFLNQRINAQLFLGYDIGKGFVTAIDDVIKFLPQMINHHKILKRLKIALAHERLQAVREMGMLQKGHPSIAVAVKTRHASRAVLNQMRDALAELKEDGLIDDKENQVLVIALEEKMKRLYHSPATLPAVASTHLLENLPWVIGNMEILEYVRKYAQLVSFGPGQTISDEGDSPNGIYIVVSGLVKVHYVPNMEIIKSFDKFGVVPNMELFLDLTFRNEEVDFFSTGTIIGEMSVLTGEPRCATVSCETVVTAYHLPQKPMIQALQLFNDPYDSLESRMWRSYGIRLATALLPTQPAYASWTLDKIRMHLERSAVPVGAKYETMTIPEYVSDVIVIQGQVSNYHTKEVYKAPSLVPRSCSKFHSVYAVDVVSVKPRVLVVAHEEIEREDGSNTSLHKVMVKQSEPAEMTGTGAPLLKQGRKFSRRRSKQRGMDAPKKVQLSESIDKIQKPKLDKHTKGVQTKTGKRSSKQSIYSSKAVNTE